MTETREPIADPVELDYYVKKTELWSGRANDVLTAVPIRFQVSSTR
jgi:hypothetical protein